MVLRELLSVDSRIRACPALLAFLSSIIDGRETLIGATPEQFVHPFSELLSTPFVDELLGFELEQLNTRPSYIPVNSNDIEFNVFQADDAALVLKLVPADFQVSPILHGFADHNIIGILGDGTATVQMYEQPEPYRNEVLENLDLP